jgi:hypothetical protein
MKCKAGSQDELNRCREAYQFVLPYLHLDIREQALRIYDLPQTPLEDYIGSLGADQPTREHGK